MAAQVTCIGQPSGTVSSTARVITSKSGRQAESEEDGKKNFGTGHKEGHHLGGRKRVRAAGQMQLDLRGEKEDGNIVQLQETVPFVDTRSPEWSRKGDAQRKLSERRLGDPFNSRIPRLNELPDRVP
jgi:hypothetical protein